MLIVLILERLSHYNGIKQNNLFKLGLDPILEFNYYIKIFFFLIFINILQKITN